MGLFCVFQSASFILEIKNSKNWPSVEGVIVSSKIGSSVTSRSGDLKSTNSMLGDIKVGQAQIEYHFAIEEKLYSGTRVSIGGATSDTIANNLLEKYPVGQKVRVYYNPRNPLNSALEFNHSVSNFVGFFVGILFIFMSIFCYRFFEA